MSNTLNRMFLEKLGSSDPTQFIGDLGEIFYDPFTGVLRISDGTTPGGIVLGALGSTGYVGSFYDTSTQNNAIASEAMAMRFNTSIIADGVQIVSNTHIKLLHTGNYNLQFSAMFNKSDAGDDAVDIWLNKNNSAFDWSNTRLLIQGNNAKHVAAWNWVVSASANDYFEIMWSSSDDHISIFSETGLTGPVRPNIPSVILTVSQI